jgi:hypothetical protein
MILLQNDIFIIIWLYKKTNNTIINQWGPPFFTWSEASLVNFLKFYLNMPATLLKFSSYSAALLQLSLGLRIFESTPLIEVGYWRLKMGSVLYSALASEPS